MKIDRKKIECAMARKKINRAELSKKANVPIGTLCNALSRGNCLPITAGKLAEALNVDVTELLEDQKGVEQWKVI